MKKLFTALICAIMVLGIGGCSKREDLSSEDVEKHLSDAGYTLKCGEFEGFYLCGATDSENEESFIYSKETGVGLLNNTTIYSAENDTIIDGSDSKENMKKDFNEKIKKIDVTQEELKYYLLNEYNGYVMKAESEKREEESKIYNMGDTVTFKSSDGTELFNFTVNSAIETSERNEFHEENPNQVIMINYSYENLGLEDELYISSPSFTVIDDDGNVLDTYPIRGIYPKECPKGTKSDGEEAYGTKVHSKKLKLIVSEYDNNYKKISKTFELNIK